MKREGHPPVSPVGTEGAGPLEGILGQKNGVELPQLGGVWGGNPTRVSVRRDFTEQGENLAGPVS